MRPLFALLLLVQAGCFWVTTKHEGEKLRADVDRIDQTLEEKVKRLEEVLAEATTLLRRNSADLGAEVDGLGKEQARVAGLVEEARRQMAQLQTDLLARQAAVEERLGKLERGGGGETTQPKPTISPDEMFEAGKKSYEAGKFDEAASMFLRFSSQFSDHKLADDALFMRAEAFVKNDQLKTAIGEYQRVFEKYPKSELADRALFRAGESSEKLKFCTDARAYYALLRQKYPKSEFAKKAKSKDAELKAGAKNPKKCKN